MAQININKKQHKFKFFETGILDEFENEWKTGIPSEVLNKELKDIFDNDSLIIPLFVRDNKH